MQAAVVAVLLYRSLALLVVLPQTPWIETTVGGFLGLELRRE
jgi:hypothetical protein